MVRFKNRYILIEVTWDDGRILESLDERAIKKALKESIETNFGDYGDGIVAGSLSVKYFSPFTNVAILRVARDHLQMVWAAITFITSIQKRSCIVRVVHVSGTIRSVQKVAIQRGKEVLFELEKRGVLKEGRSEQLTSQAETDVMALDL
ncbi:RNA-binding protein pop5 [Rhizophlyctis rosea]|nr:RNA-binding protein pop5 [Rhizophlyctis rosea]